MRGVTGPQTPWSLRYRYEHRSGIVIETRHLDYRPSRSPPASRSGLSACSWIHEVLFTRAQRPPAPKSTTTSACPFPSRSPVTMRVGLRGCSRVQAEPLTGQFPQVRTQMPNRGSPRVPPPDRDQPSRRLPARRCRTNAAE